MKGIALAILILACSSAYAFEIDAEAKAGASTETPSPLWIKGVAGFEASAGNLSFLGHLGARTDGVYGGFMGGDYGFGGLAFETVDGGVLYSGETLSASLGKLEERDIVDSPYSLFLSGRGNKALGASLGLRDGPFFYEDKWVVLSYDLENTKEDAAVDWPDRSADVKAWGLELGAFRVALQDVVVYASPNEARGPAFDLEYFLIPLPSIFVQYLGFSEDSPWRKRETDDNSMTGFMVDWKRDGWYAVGQILVDDLNMNRILNPSGRQNPDKISWMLGGRRETEYGTFGLYHAGATKYCFEPYGDKKGNSMYGYTYRPDVEYEVDETPMALEPEDNYVGYLHGENNLALVGTWRKDFDAIRVAGSLEFTLSGSKSPANPWGEHLRWQEGGSGTKLLGEDKLEKKLLVGGSVAMPMGKFDLGVEVKLGWVWNRLELDDAPGDDGLNGLRIYRPSTRSAPIGEIVLGARYHVPN
jgi:hypothetical protein